MWPLTAGSQPPGVSLASSTGVIPGRPTATGGRLADSHENASTGESTNSTTSYVEKVSSSWSGGSHSSWLLLASGTVNGSSNTEASKMRMQHNDTTTFADQAKIMFDYNDKPSYYQNNWVQIAGLNAIQSVSGTQDVDVDFKVSNPSKTAKIRDVHFVAVPMN